MAPALFLSVSSACQAMGAVADRIERVIGAGFEPVLEQDLFRLQGVSGIAGVDGDGVPADVGKIVDVVLHVKLVGAAVAAADDDDRRLGDVDHGDRIVDGRMHDIDAAIGKAGALAVRALGECEHDIQPAPGEKAAIDASEKRQRAGGAEGVDVQHRRRGGGRSRREESEAEPERKGHHAANLIHGWHPGRLFCHTRPPGSGLLAGACLCRASTSCYRDTLKAWMAGTSPAMTVSMRRRG